MKQILHIFAKDARHFLPEILVSVAITAALAWVYPSQWLRPRYMSAVAGGDFFLNPTLLASCLTVLVPVSWWLLISRVIHAEALVGDCQFWITRPYDWKKLFAAKALFLFCFLYLPIFLAQCFLLVEAGFSPLVHLRGLLFNLFLISTIPVLPLLALAAVTSSFARMTLAILGILLCFIAVSALSSALDDISISDPLPDHLTMPLLFCGFVAIVVFQYFSRRTWLARILLIALVIVIWAGTSLIPTRHADTPRVSAHEQYATSIVAVASAQNSLAQPTAAARSPKWVLITLPLQISGIADGYAWSAENVRVAIDGPQGPSGVLPGRPCIRTAHFPVNRTSTFISRSNTPSSISSNPRM